MTPNELRDAAERVLSRSTFWEEQADAIARYILATVKPDDGCELARLRAENERLQARVTEATESIDRINGGLMDACERHDAVWCVNGDLRKGNKKLSAAIAEFVDVAEDVVNCSPIEDSGRLVSERDIARLHALVLQHEAK